MWNNYLSWILSTSTSKATYLNSIADAGSRYPLLGPKRLAPRGLANSVQGVLARLPDRLRASLVLHVHAGTYTADLKLLVQSWISGLKGSVLSVAPARKGAPQLADLAILVPRPEYSPVTLALYLSSSIPFAVLVPNDLLASAFSNRIYLGANPTALKEKFQVAGKLQILATQMTWVIGNVPEYRALEMFSQVLRTPAPITGDQVVSDTFQDPVQRSLRIGFTSKAATPISSRRWGLWKTWLAVTACTFMPTTIWPRESLCRPRLEPR